ncbi:MAG: GNAT family N-acetyltransferase, partial [Campylobacterales bacterium]|nr:GNAT family N-acetyltransferase [Campylobacterales bacterium]
MSFELKEDYTDLKELHNLFGLAQIAIGRSKEGTKTVFNNSRYKNFVYDGDKLIGVGRGFGDEYECAVICDMAVDPSYQGRGIGKMIIDNLKEQMKHHLRIILYAKPGREGFYKKQGFNNMRTAMMTSYIKENDFWREIGM